MNIRMNILTENILKNVFIKPNGSVTKNSTGFPPGKMSGICYNYYLNEDYKKDPTIHSFLRKKLAKDISFSEGNKFFDSLEDEVLPKIVSSKFLLWNDERSLYEVIKEDEVLFIEKSFTRLRDDFKKEKLYFFPLYRVSGIEFKGSKFSIVSDNSLSDHLQNNLCEIPYYSKIARWLKISARSTEQACGRMEAICGSLSLTLNDPQRHQFSMASTASGHIDERGTVHSFPPRVLPSLSTNIELAEADFMWLKNLDKKIFCERENSKDIQALRFIFFSWFAASQERFVLNCMALDALIPRKVDGMKGKCEWIKKASSENVDLYSIELLFKKIRSSIIHGSSASLPMCLDYPTFVSLYRVEALYALDALTANVLKTRVFSSMIPPRNEDPEFKEMSEAIFGKINLPQIKIRSQPLKSLSKGYLSIWEKEKNPTSFLKKIARCFNSKTE